MLVTFLLLSLAILAVWGDAPGRHVVLRYAWVVLLVSAMAAALTANLLTLTGVAWIAVFGVFVIGYREAKARRVRWLFGFGIIILGAGLMSHQLTGFKNPLVLDRVRLTPDALPFRLHLNFDKAAAGILLLALLQPRLTSARQTWEMLRRAAPVVFATVLVLLGLSLVLGYVRFAPKLLPSTALFLWANLFLTCLAEEVFFRGFIQRTLQQHWRAHRYGATLALAVAAVLFGLAHFAGGPIYVLLSTLAGTGYGAAYLRTGGRLEASILTHFSVNALHFVGFTYPALQRGA